MKIPCPQIELPVENCNDLDFSNNRGRVRKMKHLSKFRPANLSQTAAV